MEKAISASDANRKFSKLLREVRDGQSYIVTSHGKPVARLAPAHQNPAAARARTALLKRLQSEPVVNIGKWTRDDLYE